MAPIIASNCWVYILVQRKLPSAARPMVQLSQIEEIHTWPHSNVQFSSCLHFVFSTVSISGVLHLQLRLQTKTNGQSNTSAVYSFLFHNQETSMSSAVAVWRHAFFHTPIEMPHKRSGRNCFTRTNFKDSSTIL